MNSDFKNESVKVKDVRLFRIRSLRFRKSHQHRCWSLTILIITWSINALPNKRGRACEVNLIPTPFIVTLWFNRGSFFCWTSPLWGILMPRKHFVTRRPLIIRCWARNAEGRVPDDNQIVMPANSAEGITGNKYNIIMIENSSNSA